MDNPLDRLAREKRRTLFMFYGYLMNDGEVAKTPYFKQAYSLSAALADLVANTGTKDLDEGEVYVVNDVIITDIEEDPTDFVVNVQLQLVQLT